MLQFWHHVYAWTCSNSDSLMVQTDQETAAYRATTLAVVLALMFAGAHLARLRSFTSAAGSSPDPD